MKEMVEQQLDKVGMDGSLLHYVLCISLGIRSTTGAADGTAPTSRGGVLSVFLSYFIWMGIGSSQSM